MGKKHAEWKIKEKYRKNQELMNTAWRNCYHNYICGHSGVGNYDFTYIDTAIKNDWSKRIKKSGCGTWNDISDKYCKDMHPNLTISNRTGGCSQVLEELNVK